MSTYSTTRLSKGPALYYRLDMAGLASNGDSIPDISGNDLHGALSYLNPHGSGPLPYGYAPLIETDSSSHSFFGHNYNIGADTEISRVSLASDALIEPSGDFTLDGWVKVPNAGMGNDSSDGTIKYHLFGKTGSCEIYIDHFDNLAGFMYDSAGTFFKVVCPTDFAVNENYHVALVRNGNSLALYVNGFLKDAATVTSGLPTRNTGGIFFVHSTSITGDPHGSECTYDEVAFQLDALGGNDILEIYEAGKAVLPLRATIIIRLNVGLNTDQVVPTDLGFPHNFSDTFGDGQIPIVEELSYKTNVNQSEPDYQQRVNARPHGAYRSFEYHLSPTGIGSRSRLQGVLYSPGEVYDVPLWRDSGLTTGVANSGTNTIPCDTTKRRYEVGSYCGACTDAQNPTTYQFFKIRAVSDTQLTLASNIGTTIPSGSIVFPSFLATLSDDSLAVKSYAADHEDMVLRFDALETELFTRDITAYTPATSYRSIEVFTLESAKVSFLDSRPYDISRRIQAMGRDYQYARDTGSPQSFPVRFLLTTRTALSDFYGWLDARQGRQNPLWVSSKEKDLTITATDISNNFATVSPKTGFSFHHGRRDIEFLKTDGTLVHRRVTSVTDLGTSEKWQFDGSLGAIPDISAISKASFLKFCVLASDTIQIRHWRGSVSECSINYRDLLTSPA